MAFLLVALAPPVSAHSGGASGIAAYAGQTGAYYVQAFDGLAGEEPDAFVYTLVLVKAGSKRPVDGATVTVTAHAVGTTTTVGPVTAHGIGNVYRYVLPDVGDSTWKVRATIDATGGKVTTPSFSVHAVRASAERAAGQAPPPTGGNSLLWGVVLGITSAVLLAGLGYLYVRRRRSPGRRASPR